mmetsp:Transcript_5470/g.7698  ORF Transcript_5470/g.7698 Transcript_5470/m.7698 type:complete len:103 (-) Transcript_5470:43-351(-)
MWNRKSRENEAPKKKKFDINLQNCPLLKIKVALKYKEKGDTRSRAHAAVVKTAPIMYVLVIGGISRIHCSTCSRLIAMMSKKKKKKFCDDAVLLSSFFFSVC